MEEVWKDILGYEGKYQVSSLGRVKSLERYVKYNGRKRLRKERILRQSWRGNKKRYYVVKLYAEGKKESKSIHRLVATAFISNPLNLPYINHIDGNPENNCVSNLEWCTASENTLHAYRTGLEKVSQKQRENMRKISHLGVEKNRKPVAQYTLDGVFLRVFESVSAANRELGNARTRINDACKGRVKQSHGFKWQYIPKRQRRNNSRNNRGVGWEGERKYMPYTKVTTIYVREQ